MYCIGGDEKGDLGSRFEPPNEKNRWDRPLIMARRTEGGEMAFEVDRILEAVAGVPAAAPNLSTIAEPRALAHNTDEILNEVVAEIMQRQKDGLGVARHVSLAELRLWRREYMNLLDLADVKKPEDVRKSFRNYIDVKMMSE